MGKSLILNLIDEDPNGFIVTATAPNILISSPKDEALKKSLHAIRVDRILLWPDHINRGTNPLIGHSLVLKKVAPAESGSNAREQQPQENETVACAVLGIVPSC